MKDGDEDKMSLILWGQKGRGSKRKQRIKGMFKKSMNAHLRKSTITKYKSRKYKVQIHKQKVQIHKYKVQIQEIQSTNPQIQNKT